MNKRKALVSLFVICSFILAAQHSVIKNVNVIDVKTGKTLSDHSVVVKDGKISWIGPAKNLKLKEAVMEVDGKGKFLMPGLIDAHIHFFQSGSLYTRPDGLDLTALVPYKKEKIFEVENAQDYLTRYLRQGITTVIDAGGTFYNFSIRDSVSKLHLSPNVIVTGPLFSIIETPQLGPDDLPIVKVANERDVDSLFSKMLIRKPDFIKVWYIANEKYPAEKSFPLVKYIGEQAKKNKLRLAVHATELNTARLAIDAGADILVHSIEDEVVPADFIKVLKEKRITYIPTLLVEGNYFRVFSGTLPAHKQDLSYANAFAYATMKDFEVMDTAMIPEFVKYLRSAGVPRFVSKIDSIRKVNLVNLFNAGINVATGTDAGNIGTFHASSFIQEVNEMKAGGLTNAQILKASTINAAAGFGREQSIGSVEQGKIADMLLLSSNPLDNIENINSIDLIFKNGIAVKPDTLIKETPEAVVQRQVNAYNARNIEAFLNTYSKDVQIFDGKGTLLMKGHDDMRLGYEEFFKSTLNLHCKIENRIVINNKVIDKEKVRMGERIIYGVAIYEVENGKIVKVTFLE